ncbi:hypothetical protein MTBLM5_210006 [Magnetospirillum sp. LM-5]|nr:hypothetical protein MTBLM5_210006 [Magnetospirillum sp. LM-5]
MATFWQGNRSSISRSYPSISNDLVMNCAAPSDMHSFLSKSLRLVVNTAIGIFLNLSFFFIFAMSSLPVILGIFKSVTIKSIVSAKSSKYSSAALPSTAC